MEWEEISAATKNNFAASASLPKTEMLHGMLDIVDMDKV
jgi:hypothetical protein